MSKKSIFLSATLFALLFVGAVVVTAPATWMDRFLFHFTDGVLRVAEPKGSIWNGSGIPVVNLSVKAGLKIDSGSPQDWQRLSAPISWQLGLDVFSAALTLSLASSELQWTGSDSRVFLSALGVRLPAAQWTLEPLRLNELPGVVGIARVSGRMRLTWPQLDQSWGSPMNLKSGKLDIEMFDVASALTPIRPLGDYRFTIESAGTPGSLKFLLNSSPNSTLRVLGQGAWADAVSIKGQMQCRRFCEYLIGVMATIGRKNGEVYEFTYP